MSAPMELSRCDSVATMERSTIKSLAVENNDQIKLMRSDMILLKESINNMGAQMLMLFRDIHKPVIDTYDNLSIASTVSAEKPSAPVVPVVPVIPTVPINIVPVLDLKLPTKKPPLKRTLSISKPSPRASFSTIKKP